MVENDTKYSGIDYIGNIPADWNIVPAKYFSSFRMGQTILKEDLIDDAKYPVYSATEKDTIFGYIDNPAFVLNVGDIVIPARGNSIGHVKLVDKSSTCTQTTIANFIDKERLNSSFLFYYYNAFRKQLFAFEDTAIPMISVEKIKENKIVIPPKQPQIRIAEFLDKKTEEIDTIIQKKESLLLLLEEKKKAIINEAITGKKVWNGNAWTEPVEVKDSGIEWIGEIPEHWDVTQLKYLTEKVGSGVTPRGGAEVYTEEGVKFIRSQNVYFDGLRLDDVVFIDEKTHLQMENSKVVFNDVLLNITGGSIGRSCVVEVNEELNVNQHVCIIRTNDELNSNYLNYFLYSNIGQTQVRLGITGGNREGLNFENLKSFIIPKLNVVEQELIVDTIKSKVLELNSISNKIQAQIDKLKEYGQSLISEAVTGKIDI